MENTTKTGNDRAVCDMCYANQVYGTHRRVISLIVGSGMVKKDFSEVDDYIKISGTRKWCPV